MPRSDAQHARDAQWIAGIRAGDPAALTAIFETYYTGLCDFAWQYVHAPAVAEELVQEVFLQICERQQHWRPGGTVQAYLFRAVRNRALNYLRDQKTKRRKAEEIRQNWPRQRTPEDEVHYKDLARQIKQAISELPERRRLIFTLHRFHGLTYEEIATTLDLSVHTVDTQMRRALRTLRGRLALLTD